MVGCCGVGVGCRGGALWCRVGRGGVGVVYSNQENPGLNSLAAILKD